MKGWDNSAIVVAVVMLIGGCRMTQSAVFQAKPLESMKAVPASESTHALDTELTAYLRGRYLLVSASYYRAPAMIPWLAISKSVQNQMAEMSIQPAIFEWNEPGVDFIEVYPQEKHDAAFAVAMPRGSKSDAEKLVGFYVLGK